MLDAVDMEVEMMMTYIDSMGKNFDPQSVSPQMTVEEYMKMMGLEGIELPEDFDDMSDEELLQWIDTQFAEKYGN